jgi:type I restriction enzyme S subunit
MSQTTENQNEAPEGYKRVQLGPRTLPVPTDWKIKRVDEITENLDRKREPIKSSERESGDVPYYGATGQVDSVSGHLFDEKLVLVGEDGADWSPFGGTSYIISGKSWVNNHVHVLRCTDIIEEFLSNYLDYIEMRQVISGTNRGKLNQSELNQFPVLYPPLPEQRRIADILSTVDEQIQQTDEKIEKTKELKRGLMQDLLTKGIGHNDYEEQYLGPRRLEIPRNWEKSRLEEVSEIITRGKQPTYVEEGGVPVLNQSCIYWDRFHPEALKRLDSEVADGWKDKYWVKEGDVLINSTGKGTLGRALEWTKESDTHALDSHITRVHPDESVLDPTYFRFYLESNHGQKMLYAFCVAGSTGQIELSKTDLQTMPILLPPIEEQREISEAFHRVNKKLQDEQETKEELQELKRGLMQDLLTGKVRVNTD